MDVAVVIRMGHDRVEDWDQAVAYAVEGERLGAGSIWSSEAWIHDCVSPLAFIAARTSRAKLGTGIMHVGTRSPALIGMTALTLQHLSKGRLIIGLGTSGPQVIEGWHGASFKSPLTRLRENVEIIRMVTRGERLIYKGQLHELPIPGGDGKAIRSPIEPVNVPIYLGSSTPKGLELAGEVADGLISPQFMPNHKELFMEYVERGAQRSGRSLAGFDIHANVSMQVTDDVDQALDGKKSDLAFTFGAMGSKGTNFNVKLYSRAGFAEDVMRVQSLWMAGKRVEAAHAVPNELALQTGLVGTLPMIKDRLRAYRDAGVGSLRFMPSGEKADWYKPEKLAQFIELVKEIDAEAATPA